MKSAQPRRPKTEQPVYDAREIKPEPYRVVRLILPDGEKAAGMWTGQVYASAKGVVAPTGWQEFTQDL